MLTFSELKSGSSVENNEIKAFKTESKASHYVYLIGGVHGDEVEGVFVLNKLFEYLKVCTDVQLPLIVVPIVNVDGYRMNTRTNAHGVDLNRNLPTKDWSPEISAPQYNPGPNPCSEPENKFLIKLFEKYPPYTMISFHSWKPMLNYNGACKKVADFLTGYNGYEPSPTIGYPTPGSMGTYLPEKFNASVLTFECPLITEGHTLKGIWESNETGLLELLRGDLLHPNAKHLIEAV
jgi:protein MpaA